MYMTPDKRRRMRQKFALASFLVLVVPTTYGIALTLKMMQSL